MISNSLKNELDMIKLIIKKQKQLGYNVSYNDIIKQLIKSFKEYRMMQAQLEPKLLLNNPLINSGLKVSTKLDGKLRVSVRL